MDNLLLPYLKATDESERQKQLDELLVDGVVSFSAEENCWVAAIDWARIHHMSDEPPAPADGVKQSSGPAASDDSRTRTVQKE